MKVNEELVDRIATLAKLEFNGEDKQKIISDLNQIISFVEKLNELDTTGVEPLVYMTDEVNVLRADVARKTITHEEALRNAPDHDSDFFRMPKVIAQREK
ncbi:MAG TPA: Asp-tRNA(Asn)/Glu-tRNA(Gln) amidotransferase subunit GatC [Bacteroidia bacterium]|nr:Asp-tRNA(Asn)/Glu-tRNA(Gln) amidotransferase subunit GatC [Bacteroidia bacterium]